VHKELLVTDDDIKTFLRGDYDRVVRVVAVVCGDRQRAEDAVQEAIVDVWTRRRPVDDLTAWVTTAALNRARSRWRSLSAERRAFDRLQRQAHPPSGRDAATLGFDARLAAALQALPRAQREAVALHYLLDLSVADVAERLSVAEGTVKTHLHRGRAALRATLIDATPEAQEADRVRP
jgi:RNA polymerase sigma-70 factor (ECF subfamily)